MAEKKAEESPAPAAEELEAATEELSDDIDDLSEQVALDSILDEERHDEIVEVLTECRERLDQLTTQSQTGESPALHRIAEDLTEVRRELAELRHSLTNSQPTPKPSGSSPNANGTEAGAPAVPTTKLISESAAAAQPPQAPPAPSIRQKRYRSV